MSSFLRMMRLALLFLGSTALAFLGIRFFLTEAGGPWAIPISIVFVGAGGMTWVSRHSFSSSKPERRFLGVGAISMNALVVLFGWSIGSVADSEAKRVAGWMTLGIVVVNVACLLAALSRRDAPAER